MEEDCRDDRHLRVFGVYTQTAWSMYQPMKRGERVFAPLLCVAIARR